jgi:hypothetical protein
MIARWPPRTRHDTPDNTSQPGTTRRQGLNDKPGCTQRSTIARDERDAADNSKKPDPATGRPLVS